MRNISFTETKSQFRARQKHRTRRGNKNGPTWKNLKPGDVLMGCEQCQGLGKGGKIVQMGPIIILETNIEPLDDIIRRPFRKPISATFWKSAMRYCSFSHAHKNPEEITCGSGANLGFFCGYNECPGIPETTLEGFPELTPVQFVEMFCEMNDCEPETEINCILFDYVDVKP